MSRYLIKQAKIFIVFLIIFSAIGAGIYFLIFPPEKATCYDGIQNQGETGIDCGGPCGRCPAPEEVLGIISDNFFPTLENNFDLVAKIQNPNSNWGIDAVPYKFSLYDENDNLIDSQEGFTYILPQETKYIIEQRFSSSIKPASMKFELGKPHWQYLEHFEELQLRIKNGGYQIIDGKYRISGVVENKSSYNLNQVEVIGALLDENYKIIAAGKTTIETLLIDQSRSFEIDWPYEINKEISSFDIRVYTNVFLDDNFIKANSSPAPQ